MNFLPNSLLPSSTVPPPSYHAFWPDSLFGQAGSGVFRSLTDCEGSTTSAFTVTIFAATVQLDTGGGDLPATEPVPIELRDILFKNGKDVTPKQQAIPNEDSQESDAQLMSDLEEA